MTREEIISGLKFTVEMFLFDPSTGEKYTEPRNDMDKTTIDACRGAIELLEQEPCEDEYIKVPKKALKHRTAGMVAYNVEWLKNHFDIERAVICGTQQPCDDAISREDVEECKELMTDINGDTVYAVRMSDVRRLPSVNPQYTEDEIQKMQELEQAEIEKAYEFGKAEGQKSEDAISRQAAIDVTWEEPTYTDPLNVLTEVRDKISILPAAEPERKTGKWIYKDDLKQFFCSECEYPSLTYDDTYIYGMDLPNYCENCGSYNGDKICRQGRK